MLRVEAIAAAEARRREYEAALMEREENDCRAAYNACVRDWKHHPEAVYYNRELRNVVVILDGGLTRLAYGYNRKSGSAWYVAFDCARCGALIRGRFSAHDLPTLGERIEAGPDEYALAGHQCGRQRPIAEYMAEEAE